LGSSGSVRGDRGNPVPYREQCVCAIKIGVWTVPAHEFEFKFVEAKLVLRSVEETRLVIRKSIANTC